MGREHEAIKIYKTVKFFSRKSLSNLPLRSEVGLANSRAEVDRLTHRE